MEIRKSSGLLACAGLWALILMSGCGKTNTNTIPTVATIFYSHTLIFRNHSAMTVGYNGFGQLGDGTLNTNSVAKFVPGLGHLAGGAAGGEHTLVFGNDSSVMAWGYNLYGQLGDPAVSTSGTGAYSASPVKVPLHGIVSAVAAGEFHSLAVANGLAYAWGFNDFGQIGNGTLVNQLVPVRVQMDQSGTPLGSAQAPVMQVAAGGSHSLALLSDGSVWAWGYNAYGQLGIDPTLPNGTYQAFPVQVYQLNNGLNPKKLSNIEQIAAAGIYSLALENDRDSSGTITGQTLWAWGYNGMGQLGQDPVLVPTSFQPVQLYTYPGTLFVTTPGAAPAPLVIRKVSAGLDHVMLLMSPPDHTTPDASWVVYTVGFNGSGQLGNGNVINSFTLVQAIGQVSANPTLVGGAMDIIAFGSSSLAQLLPLRGDGLGNWYGWGDDGSGQLGNPISNTSLGYLLVPSLVQGF